MCNLIEFTTGPTYQKYFHELTSGGVSFWLRSTARSVVVGLATKPNKKCDFELILYPDWYSLESGRQVYLTNNYVCDILPSFEFRKFWILWKNNTIVFGSGTTVFLRWKYAVENLIKYVTFRSNKGMAEWKFYLPPVATTENLPLKRLQGGEPHWVQVEDNFELPDGAMIGGFENEFLYIMRAWFRGSLTPGKFVPSVGLGFIAGEYKSHKCDTVEILCGYNCIWVPSKGNEVPAGAVVGGFTEINHETMYIGRVKYKGHVIVGKVQPSHKCCYFVYEDKTKSDKNFEVLVTPHLNFVPTYC